jgi:hypothetical protein
MIPFCKSNAKIHGKGNKPAGSAVQEVIAELETDQVKFPGGIRSSNKTGFVLLWQLISNGMIAAAAKRLLGEGVK